MAHVATCGKCNSDFESELPFSNVFCPVCKERKYQVLGILHSHEEVEEPTYEELAAENSRLKAKLESMGVKA